MSDRRGVAVLAARPDVTDDWKRDDSDRHLGDTQHEHDQREHARRRYAGDQQSQSDEDCLNKGDADDPQRNGTDGRRREFERALCPMQDLLRARKLLDWRARLIPRMPSRCRRR